MHAYIYALTHKKYIYIIRKTDLDKKLNGKYKRVKSFLTSNLLF